MKPGRELESADSLSVPPLDIVGRRDAGLDDLRREPLGDDDVGDLADHRIDLHLFGNTRLQPSDGEPLARDEAAVEAFGQRREETVVLRVGHAVSQGKCGRAVDSNGGRIALGDDFGQAVPLVGLRLGIPGARERADIVTRHGQALNALLRPPVVKDQDGAPPRRKPRRRQHRLDDRVLVIFARTDDPQIDALAAHQGRHDGVEAGFEPSVHESGPLAHRQDDGHLGLSRRIRRCQPGD